jgi:LuxR family transcriptional regulator, maltose regulon positive regulatory protein
VAWNLTAPLDGSVPVAWQNELAEAYVLEAIARDSIGDSGTADRALERALDLAEPDGLLLPFLLHPAPGLLDRHTRHPTAHSSLLAEIRGMLAGPGGRGWTAGGYGGGSPNAGESRPPVSREGLRGTVPPRRPEPLLEPLSESEVRVLRYLPTNLTTPEIARELTVSPNTVRTHVRHLYAKFGTHHRAGTVELALPASSITAVVGESGCWPIRPRCMACWPRWRARPGADRGPPAASGRGAVNSPTSARQLTRRDRHDGTERTAAPYRP